jgi:hypothetical protein
LYFSFSITINNRLSYEHEIKFETFEFQYEILIHEIDIGELHV